MLVAGNAAHADLPSTSAGSGLIGLLLSMLGQTVGFPVPEGGAGRLSEALATRLLALGGRVVTGAPVDRVVVENGFVGAFRLVMLRAAGVALLAAGFGFAMATERPSARKTRSNLRD